MSLNGWHYVSFDFAAKTGTSKDYKDNWALGYTPRWTVGVWVGNFDATSMQKVSGVTGAGPILHEIAHFMQQKYPATPFEKPEGIVSRAVCTESGLLASATCPHQQQEVFEKDNLPSTCSGHHKPVAGALRITSPSAGDVYKIDPAVARASQAVKFAAQCQEKKCIWQLNGKQLPQTTCAFFWPLEAGKQKISVQCNGQKQQLSFEVLP